MAQKEKPVSSRVNENESDETENNEENNPLKEDQLANINYRIDQVNNQVEIRFRQTAKLTQKLNYEMTQQMKKESEQLEDTNSRIKSKYERMDMIEGHIKSRYYEHHRQG